MLKKLLIGLVGLILILVIVGFLLPGDAHLERSITIHAPACTVYSQLENFHRFNLWSPWADLDPNTQYTFSGPPRGKGHKMAWVSEHKNVGSGSQEITATEPFRRLESHLDFGAQGQADVYFDLVPQADAVTVTWGFDSSFEGNFLGRYFGLFFESMLGPDYEKGLAKLKVVSEGLPGTDWCEHPFEFTDVAARTIASAKGQSPTSDEEVAAAMGMAFGKVMGFLSREKLTPAGAPFTINEAWGEEGYRFEAGLPLAQNPQLEMAEGTEVTIRDLPATRAVRLIHTGSYAALEASYGALEAYMAATGLEASGHSWAEYLNDPGHVSEEELITHIYIPISG